MKSFEAMILVSVSLRMPVERNKLAMAGCCHLIYHFLQFRGNIADLELFSQHSGSLLGSLPSLCSHNAVLKLDSLYNNKNVTK